jgi:hypothetical protein
MTSETWTPKTRVTKSRSLSSDKYVVEVEVSESGIWRQSGEVEKDVAGEWWASPGYIRRVHVELLGPFRLRREAVDSLVGPAVEAYEKQAAR